MSQLDCDFFDDVSLHAELLRLNETRLQPKLEHADWPNAMRSDVERQLLEERFLQRARAEVASRAGRAPCDPEQFVRWFEGLEQEGPGQHDPLFAWLETTATLDEFRWFLRQEVAGEAGFDDLVALTQVKMPARAKLELARNYWDEMGRGVESAMHGPMLARLDRGLELDHTIPPVPETIALGNLLAGLAFNRRYAFHAVGALGVVELTAPGRSECVNRGLKRLGIDAGVRQYYALHATLDVKHSRTWIAEVIGPLVAENATCRFAIAEGALMRLTAGARCFEKYRLALGVTR